MLTHQLNLFSVPSHIVPIQYMYWWKQIKVPIIIWFITFDAIFRRDDETNVFLKTFFSFCDWEELQKQYMNTKISLTRSTGESFFGYLFENEA